MYFDLLLSVKSYPIRKSPDPDLPLSAMAERAPEHIFGDM